MKIREVTKIIFFLVPVIFLVGCNILLYKQKLSFQDVSNEITRNDTVYIGLFYSGWKFDNLHESVSDYQYAYKVSLDDGMDHEKVAKQLSHFKIIESLIIAGLSKPIDTFPEPYSVLTGVEKIDLRSENIKFFPEEVTRMKSVTSVLISNNDLNNLCYSELDILFKSLSYFENLRFIGLANNSLDTLPSSIQRIENLVTINISGNNFKTIPTGLGELNIRHIVIDYQPEIMNGDFFSVLKDLESVQIWFYEGSLQYKDYDLLKVIDEKYPSLDIS